MYPYLGLAVAAIVATGGVALAAVGLRRRAAHRGGAPAVRNQPDGAGVERAPQEVQALFKGRRGFAVFALDAAGAVLTWPSEAEEIFGYPESAARGRPLSMLYPPPEAAAGAAELHLLNARTAGRAEDGGWRVGRDGRVFRVRMVLAARRGAGGEATGFWCLMEDLGSQGQSASGRFAAVDPAFTSPLDAARDVAIGLAPDGKITFLNRAFEKTTRLSRREWQGRPFTALVHSEDWARVADLLKRLGDGGSPPAVGVRLLAASGGHIAVEVRATPVGGDQPPFGGLLLARAAGDRRPTPPERGPAHDAVLRSQKLEALGRLAGGVAHDFNNLLTVILGYADLLSHYGADDHAREVGGEIQKAAERAASLTRQLLAFSRKQVLQPSILDLNDLVRNLDTMLRRLIGEDVQLTTALHADRLLVRADPGQLEQVLTNLVVNARDAMPKGGRLIVSTTLVPATAGAEEAAKGFAMLTVTDSGCGMDEQVQRRLFEPFFTTKEVGKGTGLGLAMVYGIVQQSAGRIEVESEPGRGSTFRVYLPLTDGLPPAAPAPGAAGADAGGKETVLLVEDEEAVRQLGRRALQAKGYTVLEAADGVAALTVCQRHLRSIDIVVTDVVMPRLSGVDLVERLRTVRPQLKVLYVSGYTDSTVVRHGVAESEANYLQKPFTPDQLAHKVRELLDQAPVPA